MGPFLAASSGETAEWCDSGIEGWRRQKKGGGWRRWWGQVKGQGSRGEREERKRERRGGRRKEKGEGGRPRRQVLISNRLLVMRSLSHCSQIDVMWSSAVHREACGGRQACMTSTHTHTHTHTGACTQKGRRQRVTLIIRQANTH